MSELQVDFVIDEGLRYTSTASRSRATRSAQRGRAPQGPEARRGPAVRRGHSSQRDIREIVRAYSPFGFIYQPRLAATRTTCGSTPGTVFRREAGKVELVYDDLAKASRSASGGSSSRATRETQDKVVLREMRIAPGQLYNSARCRTRPSGSAARRTSPASRSRRSATTRMSATCSSRSPRRTTATFNIGAGINSNGGVGGEHHLRAAELRHHQLAASWSDDLLRPRVHRRRPDLPRQLRARHRGDQRQRPLHRAVDLRPALQLHRRGVPAATATARTTTRPASADASRSASGSTTSTPAQLSLRGEDVEIHDIEDPTSDPRPGDRRRRGPQHAHQHRRPVPPRHDQPRPAAYRGARRTTSAGSRSARWAASSTSRSSPPASTRYHTLQRRPARPQDDPRPARRRRLHLRRRAVLRAVLRRRHRHRVRGFQFRGISPRSGLGRRPDRRRFLAHRHAEVSFPLAGDSLRGVVFTDAGTVEEDFEISTDPHQRRRRLPADAAVPRAGAVASTSRTRSRKDDEDDTQVISFSFGIRT